jgi:hypothetical protein
MISTLIVSGAKSDRDIGHIPTKIGTIPKEKKIGANGYRYKIQGRIQKHSTINSQIGTTTSENIFQLSLKDNLLYPGMVVRFYSGFHARVQSAPSGGGTAFVYTFQGMGATLFDFATDVTPQPGVKTCFGSYTAYGEKSIRGYSRSFYPDEFINHLTIQRKTIGISGDGLTEVLWYGYKGVKGWLFEKEAQSRLQFMMENEYAKWFGESTMKAADGSLLAVSRVIDDATGEPVIAGDGVIEQIDGGNVLDGSSPNGEATLDDITDLMTTMEKKSNSTGGKIWYCVTGTDGYNRGQELFEDKASNKFNITINQQSSNKPGGPDVPIGS